jgi:uncharacterized damage-inducible protein DinB
MQMIDSILAELAQESATTRRLLERIPPDKRSWRPHPKSMSLGQLGLHIAQGPASLSRMATLDVFEVPSFVQEEAAPDTDLPGVLDQGLAAARGILAGMSDAKLMEPFRVQKAGVTVMEFPRVALLRNLLLNHYYHHRGQLSVYLRLLDIPVPSIYGPSADESPFA